MTESKLGSYEGGHNASRPQTDKRTALRNQNKSAALGRPAMKLLGVASTSLRSTNPRPWFYLGSSDT